MYGKSFLLIACLILNSPNLASGQLIVAHRGASADAPENTLAAFQLAWQQGADAIEGDFYLTADHQIVCVHDKNMKRTSGVDRIVAQSTLEELRQLDVGRWKGSSFAGQRIPTLLEIFQIIPPEKKLYLEIKCGTEIIPQLKTEINQSHLTADQIIIIAFDQQVIREVRRELPDLQAYWLTGFRGQTYSADEVGQKQHELPVEKSGSASKTRWEPNVDQVIEVLRKTGASGLSCHAHEAVDQSFIQTLHEAGYEFHCWTVNEWDTADRMIELGVKSITTDRPGWLRKRIQSRNELLQKQMD